MAGLGVGIEHPRARLALRQRAFCIGSRMKLCDLLPKRMRKKQEQPKGK